MTNKTIFYNMKKMIISVMALAVSMMAMATESAYVRIRLTGESGSSSVVRISKDDARTTDYDDGYDSDKMKMLSNSKSVLLFGIAGTHDCEDIVSNDLTNLALGFTTNQVDQNYTLSFETFSGDAEAMVLYDLVADTHFAINGSTPAYNFTVTAEQVGRKEIKDRFVINYVAPVEPEFEICFRDNKLQISNNPYAENIVVKDENGDAVKDVAPVTPYQEIDLSALAAGRYTVELAGGARKFVIVKQ